MFLFVFESQIKSDPLSDIFRLEKLFTLDYVFEVDSFVIELVGPSTLIFSRVW